MQKEKVTQPIRKSSHESKVGADPSSINWELTAFFESGGEFLLSGLLQLYSSLYSSSVPQWRITEISWNQWPAIQPAAYGHKIQVTRVSWSRVVLPNQFKNCQPLAPAVQN